jgi:hypothetical protein
MAEVGSRRSSETRLRAGLATILTPEPPINLPLLLCRWRYELALLAGIARRSRRWCGRSVLSGA